MKDGSEQKIDGKELEKIAAMHKTLLERAINDAKPAYFYLEDGKAWQVKANVVITTAEAYSLEEHNAQPRRIPAGESQVREVAKEKVYGRFGAYTRVEVTCQKRNMYNLAEVPAYDPRWRSSTFQQLLAHWLS